MTLPQIIIRRIEEEGPVSFRDFMEMCLYYPELGYYTSAKDKIGRNGDYYTSSCLGPVFGAMVGRQIVEMWNLLGKGNFTVVEFGAGTGSLCHDILDYLKEHEPGLYRQLTYCIIEKSPAMQKIEQMHLHEKVCWYDSIRDIPQFTGCVLSNELVDNFPVHRVVMEGGLMEVFVDYKDGFAELLKPANRQLKDYLEELGISLPEGFRTEINLEAIAWIKDIAHSLKRGYILTIDYGYPSSELYETCRKAGTLMCYNKHDVNDDPYHDIGMQDITSHVNFSALQRWGSKNGLEHGGFTCQANFLLALGFKEYFRNMGEKHGEDVVQLARKEAFLTRTLLLDMGRKFKVLIQQKEAPKQELSGLGSQQSRIPHPIY